MDDLSFAISDVRHCHLCSRRRRPITADALFILSFFSLFYCTFFTEIFTSFFPTKKEAGSTCYVNTMEHRLIRVKVWSTVTKLKTFEILARHSGLWQTSSRLAANAVTASPYLSDTGDANVLQRGTRMPRCSVLASTHRLQRRHSLFSLRNCGI